jgi:hypothetical protein
VDLFRSPEPSPHEFQILLGRLLPLLRLLLKGMKGEDNPLQLDRVDRPVRVAVELVDHLEYPGTPEASKPRSGFASGCLLPAWAR